MIQGRNLIICCDGTNNQFGTENTSVIRLIQSLERSPERQLLYYDPGVGTLPEPYRVTSIGKWLSKAAGLAFGTGLIANISDAYCFLANQWQPGDRVFLFGFSRGAYTVRALAAMLHMFGLLPADSHNLAPYLLRLFRASRRNLKRGPSPQAEEYWKLCDEFRETFARAVPGRTDRRFTIHFLGVWDTVSSVGWVWNPVQFPFTRRNPSIAIVRHAVSLDERRWFFRQNLFAAADGQIVDEQWFPGVHSDVGGGYPESEGGLWREPYEWMKAGAVSAGLLLDPVREQTVWTRQPPPAKPWTEAQHESLTKRWYLAELVPKITYHSTDQRRRIRFGLWRRRRVPDGALLHSSTLNRIRDLPTYSPPNLPDRLIARIRSGQAVGRAWLQSEQRVSSQESSGSSNEGSRIPGSACSEAEVPHVQV